MAGYQHGRHGQRILSDHLSRLGFTVVIAAGDMRTMEVSALAYFAAGKFYDWQPTTLAAFNDRLHRWAPLALILASRPQMAMLLDRWRQSSGPAF